MEVMDRLKEEEKSASSGAGPLARRVVFVTGGMGGIGSAICRRLALTGHTIVAGCLPGYERKEEWLGAMRKDGFKGHAAEGDVAHFDRRASMFYNVRSVVGNVDILVNHAGITRESLLKRMTERAWNQVITT